MANRDYKWSWVACGACFWALLLIQGTVRSAGLFYVSVVEQWDLNRAQASWPFNLCSALEGVGVLLTALSQQKNVVCKGSIFAAFLFSTGFALSSLTKNIFALAFLIGVVVGYFRDEGGSYNNTYYLIGSLTCFAAVLWLMEPFAVKIHTRNQNERNNEYNDI